MPVSFTIPLLAVLATQEVTEGIKQKTFEGGKHAEYALEQCIDDSRDIHEGFYLEISNDTSGTYRLSCQIMETTTGPFYAVKGEYIKKPLLDTLTKLFEEKGIAITKTE